MLTPSLSGKSTASRVQTCLTMKSCWNSSICEHRHPRRRVPHPRRSSRTELLHSPPIQIPPATIVLSIRCTFVPSSSHSLNVSVLKTNNLCTNCLTGGHFKRQCKSCKVCQKPHPPSYTLINKIPRDLLGPNRPLQFLPMLP